MKEQGGPYLGVLRFLGRLIPGDFLRTWFYLNLVSAPRRVLRKSIGGFYRMDHIYDVLQECKRNYRGRFSILEFGVADGYSFTKKLYATRYLGMEDRVIVHGFDTFEGLPEDSGEAEAALVAGDEWVPGHYRGDYEKLLSHCRRFYGNFQLHKGLFEETLTEEFLSSLEEYRPILIWVDCDYYSSTRTLFERLIPFIPTGCVIYFDDIYFNFSSRHTGEMKAVWEINHGQFGEGIELVPDAALTWDSDRVYRFINMRGKHRLELAHERTGDTVRRRGNDSPLP